MKKIITLTVFLFGVSMLFSQSSKESDKILEKLLLKLNQTKSISFDQTRELNYASEDYHVINNWTCFYMQDSNSIGVKYQVKSSDLIDVYNATEFFSVNKLEKTYKVQEHPDESKLLNNSYFYNSILTLRNVLPILIKDKTLAKTISDTVINSKKIQIVKLNLGKKRIQNSGKSFDNLQTKYNVVYQFFVDPITNLPVEFLQSNDENKDFIKVNFSNFDLNPKIPNQDSWFYSNYKNDYKVFENSKNPILLNLGSQAPNWILKSLNGDKNVELSALKGKVVLVDFWIKNCGACIESVPFLNTIYEKYRNRDFELVSINAYDSTEQIENFSRKNIAKYPIFINGKSVADSYGVNAYPSLFVIDKLGKIIYSDNLNNDRSQIEKNIEKALKQ